MGGGIKSLKLSDVILVKKGVKYSQQISTSLVDTLSTKYQTKIINRYVSKNIIRRAILVLVDPYYLLNMIGVKKEIIIFLGMMIAFI